MKLRSISISNIRSFPYDPLFSNEVSFETEGPNLIIGPNGSGKSNLIEIITRIFSDIYSVDTAQYNDELNRLVNTTTFSTNINTTKNKPGTFTKHRGFINESSSIKFKVVLDKNDIANLKLVKKHTAILSRIFHRYYTDLSNPTVNHLFDVNFIIPKSETEYEITLRETSLGNVVSFIEDDPNSLIAKYLKDYSWLKATIDIHNDLLNRDAFTEIETSQPTIYNYRTTLDALGLVAGSKPLPRLMPTVLLMSVQERINNIDLSFSYYDTNNSINTDRFGSSKRIRNLERNLNQKSTQGALTTAASESFELLKSDIWTECASLIATKLNVSEVVKKINDENELLNMFNVFIDTFDMKLELLSYEVGRNYLQFRLKSGSIAVDINDLSTGQKAILNIAGNIVLGNRLKSLVLIDEIENHLHPSVQRKLRVAISNPAFFASQSIAITHSPIFISKDTLKSTTRVYMDNGSSYTKNCRLALRGDAKSLVNVIDYSNGARIFFTNKVLLVEGPSDQEFFVNYINHIYPNAPIEVIYTSSKTQLKNWRKIIESFGLKVFTIADLDAAKKGEIKKIRTLPEGKSLTWSDVDPSEHSILLTNIAKKALTGDFILRKGSIESYIPNTSSDKILNMRNFLDSNLWQNVQNKQELKSIVKTIIA